MVKKEGHQEPLESRVLRFIQEHQLLADWNPLLVAVSGGPDSICLLHILIKLQERLGIRLHVAHLNHQLRGAEAETDASYVADIARRLGIPFTIESRDVKNYQSQRHISLEEAAREVRYAFLAQVAKSVGSSQVAVGHTIDDHIETILMHLIRGAGTKGLRGLQPSVTRQFTDNSLTVIRPLLSVTREDTANYCHYHQFMPRIDTSNLSLQPLRNNIRHQLLPLLKNYNPRIAETLLRTARIADDELTFLSIEVSRIWDSIAQWQEDTITLAKEEFLELPPALQRHLLRTSVEKLLGNLKDIEACHIEAVMTALSKPAGKRIGLPGGLFFSIEYNRYLLGQDEATLFPFPILGGEFPLKLPGETILPGWRVEATTINRDQMAEKEKSEGALAFKSINLEHLAGKGKGIKGIGLIDNLFTAYFDLDKTGGGLVMRTRQPGDRFQPMGMSQSKKLGEFMIDAKIPHPWRQRTPIVCSPSQILWVVGWRIDERVKITEQTTQILYLEFKRH
ncbi:tRNA lysidine(34) synthetase TilS [Chloroflexota bacterium]